MNIFFLDTNPQPCAEYHCDKHVVKMVLEYSQILSTSLILQNQSHQPPCKATHIHHPCIKWCASNHNNFYYLLSLFKHCLTEYTYRYQKVHKFQCHLDFYFKHNQSNTYDQLTEIPQCMPELYKNNNPVVAYRNYYLGDKKRFAKWTKRPIPEWFI